MARSAAAGVATAETDAVEVVARVAAKGSASPGARRARAPRVCVCGRVRATSFAYFIVSMCCPGENSRS